MKTSPLLIICCGLATLGGPALAQVPDATAPTTAAPASSGAAGSGQGQNKGDFLGKDVPVFDPGSETLTWGGKSWNVNNNRLVQARLEKYLNAPEATTESDRQYQSIVSTVLNLLAPINASPQNLDAAFRLLPRGSSYEIDARLCDALADAVYSAWKSQRAQDRLVNANQALEQERTQQYWNAEHASAGDVIKSAPGQGGGGGRRGAQGQPQQQQSSTQSFEETTKQGKFTARLAEIEAQMKANQVKKELGAIQAKVEFQALIVQFFFQRRYQHVLMATRFYRSVFNDGDTKLNLPKESKDLFEKTGNMPPTVGTLDSMANEALRDVKEGVQAFNYLVEKNELESATKRLAEAFVVGEYVPDIRTLPREKKRKALEFVQKSNQLISALDVKDYALAEQLVNDLGKVAKDFDNSKPMAKIETSKTLAQMRLQKAKNAALSGDKVTLETELTAATELWPRNPQLAEYSQQIFARGDVVQKALLDFDQLLSQKNYRQIFDDKARYIGATAQDTERQKQLNNVLDNVQVIEIALMQSNAAAQQGNYAGAWESLEKIAAKYPEDNKLSQSRANLTTQAAEFVRTLRKAEEMEKKDQVGSSLAWYLKARKIYPQSEFATDGVDRLVKKVLPES